MTVTSSVQDVAHATDGVTVDFPIPFLFLDARHIVVDKIDGNGEFTPLVLETDFTVSGAGNANGGTLRTFAAYPPGFTLHIYRVVPATQETQFQQNDPFPSKTTEAALDKLTMIAQQNGLSFRNSIRYPASEYSRDGTLPTAQNRISKLLGFDALGGQTLIPIPASVGAGDLRNEVWRDGVGFQAGVSTNVSLSRPYGTKANLGTVVMQGVAQDPDTYSLAGTTLTFLDDAGQPTPIPVGVTKVWCVGGTTISLGSPAFHSVDDDALMPGSKVSNSILARVSLFDFMEPAAILASQIGWTNIGNAMQDAIDTVLALPNGGEIFVPNGMFQMPAAPSVPITAKTLRIVGQSWAAQLRLATGTGGATIEVGRGSVASPGVDYVFSNFQIKPPASGTASGMEWWNANTARCERVFFAASLTIGVKMTSCFATSFRDCQAINLTLQFVYSTTAAHNITLERCLCYGVGGVIGNVLRIDGATNNITIQNCDIESCANVYHLVAGCSSIKVTGCYIEYCANMEFYHEGICYGAEFSCLWIAYNTQIGTMPNGGGNVQYQNLHGGRFDNVTVSAIHITFAATCDGIDDGGFIILAGATVGGTPFNIPTMLNGWASGSRQVGYRRSQLGDVELRGQIVGSAVGQNAFVIPSGYRPAQPLIVPVVHADGTIGSVSVLEDGSVRPLTVGGGATSVDGIRFRALPQ